MSSMADSAVILLAEDREDDILLIRQAFARAHIPNPLFVVKDGEEALEYLLGEGAGLASRALPNVVLLDLNLPKIDGLEVLQRLRADQRTRRLPVVVLTSSNEESDILSSYDLGANSFVRKPVDFAQFAVAAQQLGLYWLVLNEPPHTEV